MTISSAVLARVIHTKGPGAKRLQPIITNTYFYEKFFESIIDKRRNAGNQGRIFRNKETAQRRWTESTNIGDKVGSDRT